MSILADDFPVGMKLYFVDQLWHVRGTVDGLVVHDQNGAPVALGARGAAFRVVHDGVPIRQELCQI